MTKTALHASGWRLGAVLAALALSTAAPATAQEAPRAPSGTLVVAWPWDPGTMDPQMHRLRHAQVISHTMREKLYYQPPPGVQRGPLLAEQARQVDDTTYDFKLREGVRFHNGDELTSEDVVYTFRRLWDPANKSPRATMAKMASVESVEAVDRYTVRFKTKIPFGPAEIAADDLHLAGQEILHKATYETLTLAEAASAPVVGVGPFKFVEWLPDQRIVMDANLDYWQGPPGVERIIWRTIPEEATRVAELLAGSVDLIYPVTPDSIPELRAAGMTIETVPGTSADMLMMNVREGSPFHDVEVRKAMNMAIDKHTIVEHIYRGLALVNDQVASAGQEGLIEGWVPFPYDPEAARAVLSRVTEPIELLVRPQLEMAAEIISEQLRGYGMKVTTVVMEPAGHANANDEGKFDLLLGAAGYGGGTFTGAYYENQFSCGRLATNRIRTGFCDEGLDARILAAESERDPAARLQLIHEVVREISAVHVPWVPLFTDGATWVMQPNVTGFVGSSAGQMFDMQNVRVD